MQTSREVITNTLLFKSPDRLGYDFPTKYGTDFLFSNMDIPADSFLQNGFDEWGCGWRCVSGCSIGEVVIHPLDTWDRYEDITFPDMELPSRWFNLDTTRYNAGEKFLTGQGISLYHRPAFLRGINNLWADIYMETEKLGRLLDRITDMNIQAIKKYASAGFDGFFSADDWGLQRGLSISPGAWRDIWKPRYAKIYDEAHRCGLFNFLHSCGNIMEIIDDLIDIGLDALHLDQQENMGLKNLGELFKGRITFFATVDIQQTMIRGVPSEIRVYCRDMTKYLSLYEGGFIPRWYTDPVGVGHQEESISIMCEEFLKISKEIYGR